MRNLFDRQLEELHVELIEMGSMCEDVIRKTSKLLQSGDIKVAKEIRKEDCNIDDQERLVESLCLKLLLQQQPVAKDLRKVSAALKMITDMERIGDQASDIAEIIETAEFHVPTSDVKLSKMAETTITMVTESIDAYVKQDLELVREVIARDDEVDDLYRRYIVECDRQHKEKSVTRKGLRDWYNGYYTKSGERVYNPRSVVFALQFNNLANYWTSSGPYDEIYYYIRNNISDVRDDLALMISGESVTAKIQEYAATSMNLSTRDEIYSAMVVYGFLSYLNGKVCIPNRELMEKFDELLVKNESLGYVYRLAKESEKMLKATLAGDTLTMERILEFAHNTEVPLLSYNHETELSAIVNLVYLAARDSYRVEREDKAGTGYVDFIFYPYDTTADCIILELKVDHTPDEAIAQIIDKKYALKFMPKIAGQKIYTGRILAVGIGYWKESKKHSCKVEEILK